MEQATTSLRLLVVDDNADAAFLTAELLKFRGHLVDVATGGPEGYAIATSLVPDVIILDIGMPIMDGYQVALALRAHPLTHNVRLVALTAWGDVASREAVIKCGFDSHLVKPANLEALFYEIEFKAA